MVKPSLVTWCHGTALGVEHLGKVGIFEPFPHLGLVMIANVSVVLTIFCKTLKHKATKPPLARKWQSANCHQDKDEKDNGRNKLKNLLLGPDHRNQSIGINSNCQRLLSPTFSNLGWFDLSIR